MALRLPSYGIEIVEGVPGSGKTFVCVDWMLTEVMVHRRPVFTNLPVKFRVFRKYVKNRHGENVANLIQPLTREHFIAFVERAKLYMDWRERLLTEAQQKRQFLSEVELDRRWVDEHGEDLWSDQGDGRKANWIPVCSALFIDEIHKWFPQAKQKDESGELLAYTSMHRHFLHRFICISQHRMNITISVRRMAEKFWKVHNRSEDKLAWNIRFKHLGLKAFGYEAWTESAEALPVHHEGHRPFASFTIVANGPRGRLLFRLYNSFTGSKSPRKLVERMKEVRTEAGLTKSGHTREELEMFSKRMRKRMARRASFGWRWTRRLFFACIVGTLGFGVGRGISALKTENKADATQLQATQPVERTLADWPVITSITANHVRLGKDRVRVGETYRDALLVRAEPQSRLSAWVLDGVAWIYAVGQPEPIRVGSRADLERLAGGFSERGQASAGGADPGRAPQPPVEPGDVLR